MVNFTIKIVDSEIDMPPPEKTVGLLLQECCDDVPGNILEMNLWVGAVLL